MVAGRRPAPAPTASVPMVRKENELRCGKRARHKNKKKQQRSLQSGQKRDFNRACSGLSLSQPHPAPAPPGGTPRQRCRPRPSVGRRRAARQSSCFYFCTLKA